MSLLNLSNLSSTLEVRSVLHFLVSCDRSTNNVGNTTLLLVTDLLCLSHITGVDSLLYADDELAERALTESGTKSEETLDRKSDYSKEQCDDHRNDDTTFVNCTEEASVLNCVCRVSTYEVVRVSKYELEETYCEDETYNDNPNCVSNALESRRLFLRTHFSLCICHNFKKEFNKLLIIEMYFRYLMLNSGFPLFIDCDLLVFCQFGAAKITNNGK